MAVRTQGGSPTRLRAYTRLVAALAGSITAHRLYPDDPDQPVVRQAIERVREAAKPAVAGGPVRLEIRGGTVHTEVGPLPPSERTEHLVAACFDRRVELLIVRSVPTAEELWAFAEVLSAPPEDLLEGGGVHGQLEAAGVRSILAREFDPSDELAEAVANLDPRMRTLLERLRRPESLASLLTVSELPDAPEAAALDVYERFADLAAALPEDVTGREGVYRLVRRVVDNLPVTVRRAFFSLVVSRVESEEFAARYLGQLTDVELARSMADLRGTDGPGPEDLAASLIGERGRHPSLRRIGEVLDVLEETPEESSEAASRPLLTVLEPSTTHDVVDQLGQQLISTSDHDVRELSELFPSAERDHRTLALLALHDYLRAETDTARREEVLGMWAREVVGMVADPDVDQDALARVLAAAQFGGEGEVAAAATATLTDAIDVQTTRRLLETTSLDPDGGDPATERLEPLGDAGLEAVLAHLAVEEEAGYRARLVSIVADLLDDPERLRAWTHDERWYVVRNVVSILARRGSEDGLALLSRLVQHDHPSVRREVARALPTCGGAQVVPELEQLALDRYDDVATTAMLMLRGLTVDRAAEALGTVVREAEHDDRRYAALDALAAHPSPAATDELEALASRRRPRLSWRIRWQARRRLRERRS